MRKLFGILKLTLIITSAIIVFSLFKREPPHKNNEINQKKSAKNIQACDNLPSKEILRSMSSYASWTQKNEYIEVIWNYKDGSLTKDERKKWPEIFSKAFYCITGEGHKIQFYLDGRLVALTSPDTGTWILE